MSTISAGTTTTTALVQTADTTGNLVFQTQNGTYTITVPNVTGTLAVSATPTVTTYTSGSGTYTTPTNAKYLTVQMVGGGAGGSASSNGSAGGAGGTTTFGSSFLTCTGGISFVPTLGGTGGTATGGDELLLVPIKHIPLEVLLIQAVVTGVFPFLVALAVAEHRVDLLAVQRQLIVVQAVAAEHKIARLIPVLAAVQELTFLN